MPLDAPKLDDRSFQDLVDEAKRRIPRYCPEWTDHNVSDPGVTLIELFAYMVDLLLYRINRVPERNYIKWLDLMGITLAPPRPARVDLTFTLTAAQPEAVTIPRGTEVGTVRTDTQEATIFSTEADLTVQVPQRLHCLVRRDDGAFYDYEPALRNQALNLGIFQDPPQPGDAVYFGYQEDLPGHLLRLALRTTVEGVGVDPTNPPLAWECWKPAGREWTTVGVDRDTTGGFNKPGEVQLQVPAEAGRRVVEGREAFWLRARYTPPEGDQSPYAGSPRILSLDTEAIGGTVVSSQVEQIRAEVLGRSNGRAGQEWPLQYAPVMLREPGELLEIEGERGGTFEPWIEVENFGASGADDPHYTLDSLTGVIRFGPTIRDANGRAVQLGRIPPADRLLRFTHYRFGGGSKGNVGRNTIAVLKSSIPYVSEVTNRRGAVGGEDAESLELAKLRAPQLLRQRTRAVTKEDFETLTLAASPEVARCRCLPPTAADIAAAGVPVVRMLVVPRVAPGDSGIPREDLELPERVRKDVSTYLDARRVLTTVVELAAPPYTWVRVEVVARARRRGGRGAAAQTAVQEAILRRLYDYINPIWGGPAGNGRDFGEALYLSEVTAVVQGVEGVEYVELVQFFRVDPVSGEETAAGGSITPVADGLLASHEHQVTVR